MTVQDILKQSQNSFTNIWVNAGILRRHTIGTNAYQMLALSIKKERATIEKLRVLFLPNIADAELHSAIIQLDADLEKFTNQHPSFIDMSGYHSLIGALEFFGQEWLNRRNASLKPPACDSRHCSNIEYAGGAL
ncbi:hypothetical protein [Pseudoalteromonas sp. T1lg48]|uniref:hypothetical protein n=1 Tax=Pseudoalteromonas sp. T1lg48 TaxID=2077100 RepID=UPI000CF64C96|nr:hypothetical protein [Pseudoalteromonas sp. T1lg48]